MSKSVLVIDTPENCYDCPFGTSYCGELEYEGLCELADCLDCDEILITEEHYDCESKSKPVWCPLKPLPEKKEYIVPNDNVESQKDIIAVGWNAGAKQPIIPMTVSEIHFLCYKNERAVRFDAIGKEDMGESCYRLEDIGRIVFLTREEAEKKLEEMKK